MLVVIVMRLLALAAAAAAENKLRGGSRHSLSGDSGDPRVNYLFFLCVVERRGGHLRNHTHARAHQGSLHYDTWEARYLEAGRQ